MGHDILTKLERYRNRGRKGSAQGKAMEQNRDVNDLPGDTVKLLYALERHLQHKPFNTVVFFTYTWRGNCTSNGENAETGRAI